MGSGAGLFGGWGDERFQSLARVFTPTGVTPVTLMAASISQQVGDLTVSAMVYDPNDRTNNAFDRLFVDGVNVTVSAQWSGRLWKHPSSLGLAYTLSDVDSGSRSRVNESPHPARLGR